MKEKINVGLVGLGTVGYGVYKVINMQKEDMKQKLGCEVAIKKICCLNPETVADKVEDPSVLTESFGEVVNDPDIDIIVEVIGGIEPAKTFILSALNAGKHVVTANKDLIAVHGHEILETASKNGVDFLFEASVAGAIPIIRPLKQCLAANHIDEIMGIVNGTTNFILTKMSQEGMDYAEALALATELGYAEADPTSDVEGLDAARKVAIMASIAFNSTVRFDDVYKEGITKITAKDINYADEMGYVIKLLGVAKNPGDGIEVSVNPMLIQKDHPLASVNDSFNAIFVHGDAVGDCMFYGRGAGELPTASAVVGDIFDIARNINADCCGRIGCGCYKTLPIKSKDEIKNKFFLRFLAEDRAGVLAQITSILGDHKVSIEQIIQKRKASNKAEIVVMTEAVQEKNLSSAVEEIRSLDVISDIASLVKVYDAK